MKNTQKKKTCTVRIRDEVNCVFVGLHPDHVAYFYDEYGVFASNHFFNPKFKLGTWDGKIRYFHRTGKTYVNLLSDVIPRVVGLGYNVQITDLRQSQGIFPEPVNEDFFNDILTPDTNEPWKMRDYQIELVNTLLENGGGIGIAGTGGGKTSMTAALALSYERTAGYRTMIIVPDKNLTDQTYREYQFFGLDVGQYSGTMKDLNHSHIVSTWQALKNNPSVLHDIQVVIVDEAHGIKGKVLTDLLLEHGKHIAYRFGVTGTLPKDPSDSMAVRVAVGEVQYTIPAHELIEQGYLASLHIDVLQYEVDLKEEYDTYLAEELEEGDKPLTYRQFKDAYFPDYTSEKNFSRTEKERTEWIVEYLTKLREKGNVFCLIDGIQFGKKLTGLIEGAIFVHGKDDMDTRRQVYDLFKDHNNLVVIANVQVASTGLDIKRIFNLVFIDMGKSFIRVIQSVGRGLRKAIDKDYVHVTDICSDLKYSRRHLRERTKFYAEAKYPYSVQTVKR